MADLDDIKDKLPFGKKKKEGKLSKVLMGVVIGGAIGSVLGVTLADKENRDFIKKKTRETWDKSSIILGSVLGKKEKKKESIWHKLHQILVKKEDEED